MSIGKSCAGYSVSLIYFFLILGCGFEGLLYMWCEGVFVLVDCEGDFRLGLPKGPAGGPGYPA